MISNEEAVAFLMLFGRSEAKARKILASPSGVNYKSIIEEFVNNVRMKKNDPTLDVLTYLQNNPKEIKRKPF